MRRCYIIVRQLFYLSGGVHYQCAEDNPVRDVFTTEKAAITWARDYILYHINHSDTPLHMVEEKPDSELIYKVGAFDAAGNAERVYCVIKKGLLQ